MRATGAVTGYLQLYNDNTASAITGSEISTSSTSFVRVRSGDIEANMPGSANTLRSQFKTSVATNVEFREPGHVLYFVTLPLVSGGVRGYMTTNPFFWGS